MSQAGPNSNEPSLEIPPLPEPLAELRGTKMESRLIHEAQEKAIASCMKRKGFAYKSDPYRGDTEIGVASTLI